MTPIFSTLVNVIEIELERGWVISFVRNDILRDLLGYKTSVIHEQYILPPNPVDKLSNDKTFLEIHEQSGKIPNFTLDVDHR